MRDEELFRAYWKNYILNQYPSLHEYEINFIIDEMENDIEIWNCVKNEIDTLIDLYL